MSDLINREEALIAISNLYPDAPRLNIFGSYRKWREKYKPYIESEEAISKIPSANQDTKASDS